MAEEIPKPTRGGKLFGYIMATLICGTIVLVGVILSWKLVEWALSL